MKVYQKASHTNKYINWRSHIPKSFITGATKSLTFRAYDLCTMKEDRHEELEFLKNTFIVNDCPPRLVDGIFKKYIPRRHNANYGNTKEEKQEDFGKVLNLPFIKGFSDKVRRDL